jgi:hypothetical protein
VTGDSGPLVLDGQRSGTGANGASTTRRWCQVPSGDEGLRIVTSDGRMFRPACKRRDCPRCWARRSRETARALVLDARQDCPRYCMTLTTRTPWQDLDPEAFRRGVAQVVQRLRRRYGRCEYFAAVEFTTGRGRRSGGHRRMHAHALLKMRDGLDVIEVEQLVRETWQRADGAYVVEVAQLVTPGAALGYLALHHRKPGQAPPAAWCGMTERSSRGYWHRPIADLREQARRELTVEAIAHVHELPLELAELEVELRGPGRLIDTAKLDGATLRAPKVGWRP